MPRVDRRRAPLSNSAVRRAEYWRGFRQYLRDVARDRHAAPPDATVRQWLPFAVAIGLAPAWATYLKRHRGAAPHWFQAVGDSDSSHAFAAFVGVGGAGTFRWGARSRRRRWSGGRRIVRGQLTPPVASAFRRKDRRQTRAQSG